MSRAPRIVGIIPARMAATRLPGKPLRLLAGRPMIEHVYRRAARCPLLSPIAATDASARSSVAAIDKLNRRGGVEFRLRSASSTTNGQCGR